MKYILTTLLVFVTFLTASSQETSKDSLQQYTGKYKFPDGSLVTEVTVSLSDTTLQASSAIGSAPLRRNNGDEFEILGFDGTMTFKRNADGKVTGVQIIVGDTNIEGTKTDGIPEPSPDPPKPGK
jgi:hypothetical protein